MSTDQLIRALAADRPAQLPSLRRQMLAGIAVGVAIAAVLFAVGLGFRPDIAAAVKDPRFLLKFAVTLALAVSTAGLLLRLLRPAASKATWAIALLIGPMLLAAGSFFDLFSFPSTVWQARLIGRNALLCLVSIPLMAAPILVALLVAVRRGAPTRPAVAGAAVGLLAASLGATLYAAHCIDDSPLFVFVWYGIAITGVTALGAALGARVLRW